MIYGLSEAHTDCVCGSILRPHILKGLKHVLEICISPFLLRDKNHPP